MNNLSHQINSDEIAKYARWNEQLFIHKNQKIKKREKQFLKKLGDVLGKTLDWNSPIPSLPATFYQKHANNHATYIHARRMLIKDRYEANKLTPYALLNHLEHFKPVTKEQNHEKLGQWETYTYIDAKYDFLEDEVQDNIVPKSIPVLSVKDYISQTVKPKLKQLCSPKDHLLNYKELKQIYKLHYENKYTKDTVQNFKERLLSLRSNLRRVVHSRKEHRVSKLTYTPDVYNIIFVKGMELL